MDITTKHRRSSTLLLLVALGSCADSSSTFDAGRPDAAVADAGPSADAADAATADVGTFASCAELPANTCFSNADCASDRRCQDVGAGGDPLPCCVIGARGSRLAGESCDSAQGESQCASSICIEGGDQALCSAICRSAQDCPANMPRCIPIAFSDSTDEWCFPP